MRDAGRDFGDAGMATDQISGGPGDSLKGAAVRLRGGDTSRTGELRQAFLVRFADTLRPLESALDVQAEASRALGEHMGASRVTFFEVRGEDYLVGPDYFAGMPSMAGRHAVASFGEGMLAAYRAGHTAVESDTEAQSELSPDQRAEFAAIGIRSYIGVPLIKGGEFVAGLAVQSAPPRAWKAGEVALVEEVAERIWAAVMRARTEEELRRSEDRLRMLDALGEATRELADPRAVMAAAARLLGERLRVTRCAYADVEADGDRFTIRDDWTAPGALTTAGTYSLDLFGPRAVADLHAGRILILRHVDAELARGDGGADMFNAIGVKAIICCPLVKEGRLRAMMAVHSAAPRDWTDDEVTLVRGIAERSWAHIERVRAEAALRESEEQTRVAVATAKLGQWSVDLRTAEMTCTEGCKRNYGRPLNEPFSYAQLWESVHPGDRERVQAAVRTAIQTRTDYDVEYRVFWPDGGLHWVLVRGRASYDADGTPTVMNGMTLDLTERKLSEERLRESEERYRLLFNSIDEGFCLIDMVFDDAGRAVDYVFVEANPAFEQHTGLVGAVGRRVREMVPDHDGHWFEIYGRVARTGEPIRFEQEAKELRRWYDVYAFRPGGEGSTKVAVVSNDMTARRLAAQERERLFGELQAQDRRKDEFLAMLSHELRNPLAPIANAVQLLRLHGGEDSVQREARTVIERQVGQLRHLIDDLLEVSRITTGRVQLQREHVTMSGIVERALETAQPLITRRRHALTVQVPSEPIWLQADAARLEQVLVNLLTNAAKYTDEGGGITMKAEVASGEAVLRVRDTGVGIAPELLPHIFDLFTQGDRSLARSEGGLGIGLALVQRLVELHGGRVEATSVVGEGSEFVVRLPLAEPPAGRATAPTPEVAAATSTGSCRVLVVDDNVDSAGSLARLLRLKRHEVRTAHDGAAALAAAIEQVPDVVLLDIGLPEMDGYEVARRLRAQPTLANAVLVALTGYGQESDRRLSREAGFDHHMVKPADFAQLQQILSAAAARKG